jgi:hypothetical protein
MDCRGRASTTNRRTTGAKWRHVTGHVTAVMPSGTTTTRHVAGGGTTCDRVTTLTTTRDASCPPAHPIRFSTRRYVTPTTRPCRRITGAVVWAGLGGIGALWAPTAEGVTWPQAPTVGNSHGPSSRPIPTASTDRLLSTSPRF